jgi:hypothetical protein
MAAKDSAELREASEDMRDTPRQLARKIQELAERNQKIVMEIKALANKVEQMEKRRPIEDMMCDKNEMLFQVFPQGSKYHRCPVGKTCRGASEPDEDLQLPLRLVIKLGKEPCKHCCPPELSSSSPR